MKELAIKKIVYKFYMHTNRAKSLYKSDSRIFHINSIKRISLSSNNRFEKILLFYIKKSKLSKFPFFFFSIKEEYKLVCETSALIANDIMTKEKLFENSHLWHLKITVSREYMGNYPVLFVLFELEYYDIRMDLKNWVFFYLTELEM